MTMLSKVAWICPKCWNISKSNIIRESNDQLTSETIVVNTQEVSLSHDRITGSQDIDVRCKSCKHKSANGLGPKMFMVDSQIADIIVDLNKLGYHTIFSCEGHVHLIDVEGNCYDPPYIVVNITNQSDGVLYRCISDYITEYYNRRWQDPIVEIAAFAADDQQLKKLDYESIQTVSEYRLRFQLCKNVRKRIRDYGKWDILSAIHEHRYYQKHFIEFMTELIRYLPHLS